MGQVLGATKVKQILTENEKGGFKICSKNLDSILLADDVINKPVVVISVAGASSKGKSFLLDAMQRYLSASDWMGEKTQGFMKQSLDPRQRSAGILTWSEPFPVTLPTGEEAVVVLLDTQVVTSDQSAEHKSQAVFALSALLSSVLIFNVMENISDDDLEHIQPLLEYGQRMLDETSASSFQKLLFLVRDWEKNNKLPPGDEGGDRLVTKLLQKRRGDMLADVRGHIGDCFSDIHGFLLPPPGQQVASSPDYDIGNSASMDPSFVAGLKDLMPKILAPDNLNVKTIAGNLVTARDLHTLFSRFVKLFSSDELPTSDAMMQATTKASLKIAVQQAKSQYVEEMKKLLREDQPSVDPEELVRKQREAATRAEKAFNDHKKMGDDKMKQKHLKILVTEMAEWFRPAEEANAAKHEKEKRKSNEDHILGLIDTCAGIYTSGMERVVGSVGMLPRTDINSAHNAAKEKAMARFDVKIKGHSVDWDCRFTLARVIGAHFRLMLRHNDVKEDVAYQQMARTNMRAVIMAHKCYRTMINGMLGDEPTEDELQDRHQDALQAASDTFESLAEGEEHIIAGYFEGLKKLIDEDLEIKKHTLSSSRASQSLEVK